MVKFFLEEKVNKGKRYYFEYILNVLNYMDRGRISIRETATKFLYNHLCLGYQEGYQLKVN